MDALKGRYQCTRGIWLSKSKFNNILVIDAEGTDSRERIISKSLSFERKISLFSLAIADIFIINIWYHDVGRYDAAGMNLLKTIFELNLQIFSNKNNTNKKNILFVFRDHTGDTSLDNLKNIIVEDTNNIWNDIHKPDEYKQSHINDFFDFDFHSISHKNLNKIEFKDKINDLRNIFKKINTKSLIPMDGLPIYLSNVWDTIKNNKNLDIPNQKKMVSIYRCKEISSDMFNQFKLKLKIYIEEYDNDQIINNFGNSSRKLLDEILIKYKNETVIYDTNIRNNISNDLHKNCVENIKNIWLFQIKLLNNAYVQEFKENLDNKSKHAYKNFNIIAMKLRSTIFDKYIQDNKKFVT